MKDHLSRGEIRKDALQDSVEATASAVGSVTTIVTTAVRDIARAVGGLATELFEIRESVRRAAADHDPGEASSASTSSADPTAVPGDDPADEAPA